MVKRFIRSLIPKPLLLTYHRTIAMLAAFWYGFPSHSMVVIGVTGTKGKSSTCILIGKILEHAGYTVGICSTAIFKIGKKEWLNDTKMTMLGRFALQKRLKEMVVAGCQYAIVETSSEGIAQYRHKGIEYDVAVFTNLSPEHIESHGSFEKYREVKGELFKTISLTNRKIKIINGKKIDPASVINLDDEHAQYFLQFNVQEKVGFTIHEKNNSAMTHTVAAKNLQLYASDSSFLITGTQFFLSIPGECNVYNALAAIATCSTQNISCATMAEALSGPIVIPGRFEIINEGQNFTVIVDYAHEPRSFKELYKAVARMPHGRIIHVFGAPGGGRDKSKRPIMGNIAAQYADEIIITNDDPYEENQIEIAHMIAKGISEYKIQNEKYKIKTERIIIDRGVAINTAIAEAKAGDVILITGKGAEQVIMIGGRKLPWDDRKVVKKAIHEKIRTH